MSETLERPICELKRPKLARLFRLQWEPVQDAHVLLYPEGMVKLNESAAAILQACTGLFTIPEIVTRLETEYDMNDLGAEIEALLAEAQRRGWIVEGAQS
jgi:pyrroloquinoline quinone biosynthesis protein D